MECLGVWFCRMKVLERCTRLKLVSSFNAAAPTFSVAGTLVVQGLIILQRSPGWACHPPFVQFPVTDELFRGNWYFASWLILFLFSLEHRPVNRDRWKWRLANKFVSNCREGLKSPCLKQSICCALQQTGLLVRSGSLVALDHKNLWRKVVEKVQKGKWIEKFCCVNV